MRNSNLNDLVLLFGIAGFAYAVYTSHKMTNVCKKIDKSIDDISLNLDVDLSESVVNAAVEKAVDREAHQAVRKATEKAIKDIENDIHKEVKSAVQAHYSSLKDDVAKEMRRQVGDIDIREIREDVIDKAKEQLAAKFDDNLDGLLDKFNGDLNNVSKIYNSIARSMTNDSDKGMTFRIG